MPVSCAAYGCNSRNTLESRQQGVTFHRFPLSNKPLLQEWRLAMKRSKHNGELWMPSPYQRICSLHFEKQSFDETGQTRRLRSNAVPSIFNFPDHFEKLHRKQKGRKRKYEREDSDYDVCNGAEEVGEDGGGIAVDGGNNEDDEDDVVLPSVSKDVLQNPHLEHSYSTPDIDSLKRKLQIMEKKLLQKMKELRAAKERERRPRETCGTLLRELSRKKIVTITQQLMENLQQYEDIPVELFDKSPTEYSTHQKSFVLMLQLHDSSVYRYIKNHKLPFPSLRMLRSWLKSTNDGPGINASVLQLLLNKRLANPYEYTCACLVIGALSLRQHAVYDVCQKKVVGLIDYGNGPEAYSQNVATQTLIFMLVGINGHWKAPIAYFLTNSLTPGAQMELVLHALHELMDNGFDIKSITLDGCETNIQMCTMLGCDFSDPAHLQTHFTIPGTTKSCYVVIDVYKEAGLLCNLIETYESVKSNKGTIRWQHIKNLKVLNMKSGIFAGTKSLQDTHFLSEVEASPAAEILSDSAAKTLLRLHDLRYENFSESDATAFFLQTISKLLDVFCSRSPRIKGYKGAVDNSNLQHILGFLSEVKAYLLSLTTVEGTMLYDYPRKTCIICFLISIQSFCEMLPRLLTHQKYVLTYKFSQDFVKNFFNDVHAPGELGYELTASQVKHGMRKWLIRCGINIDQDNETAKNSMEFLTLYEERSLPIIFQQHLPSPFEDNSIELPDHNLISETLNFLLNNPLVYFAGWVVRKAMTEVACDECRCALVSDTLQVNFLDAHHLLQLKENGRLVIPSSGTVRIILSSERKLRHMMNASSKQYSVNLLRLEHEVLLDIGSCDVLGLSKHMAQSQCGIDNHHFYILRLLVSVFYRIRQQHFAKLEQWELFKCKIKQKFTKTMHCKC